MHMRTNLLRYTFFIVSSIFLCIIFLRSGQGYCQDTLQEMKSNKETMTTTAVLGGGCFWCIEAIFQRIEGVNSVESGYSGDEASLANYEAVSSGNTKHVEVVRVSFDESKISFADILEIFFHLHDPTTKNRQGADVGTQYKSVVFYANEDQKKSAEKIIEKITKEKLWDKPIVTEIIELKGFYKAEDYHQNYYNNNKAQPYCSLVIGPKIQKLKIQFANRLKPGA
jgi:peptide-methionine (S)-S-oxide reductase